MTYLTWPANRCQGGLSGPALLRQAPSAPKSNRDVQAELVEVMQQHPAVSGQALNAIIISRNLERAADHATNIAEDVVFWVRGSDVRHKFSLAEAD